MDENPKDGEWEEVKIEELDDDDDDDDEEATGV